MKTRVLAHAEWDRIVEVDGGAELLRHADPSKVAVLVVEDGAGQIVGSWLVLQTVHVECLWVAPHLRGRASVFRRLLAGMTRTARALGVDRVLTSAVDPVVDGMLARYGGTPLPGTPWVFPLKEEK